MTSVSVAELKKECETVCVAVYPEISQRKGCPSLEVFQERAWAMIEQIGTGKGSYSSPVITAELQASRLPHSSFRPICEKMEKTVKAKIKSAPSDWYYGAADEESF